MNSLCHNKIMNDQESYEFEGRRYVSPTLSSTEQANFIDNLRNVQAQNNAQIAQQTHDLGTQVPSNLGGLGGGESYFNARYQTPQANEVVSTLKAAAQAQELNDVMNNYKAQLQNRYKQKYREYNKAQREYNKRKQYSGGNGGGTPVNNPKTPSGNVKVITGDTPMNYEGLAFRRWQENNGYDIYANPQTVRDSGVPAEAIVAANEALKQYRAKKQQQEKKQEKKRNAAFQPFYSGQLVL